MQKELKKMEQAARAAWLYFVAGKTQQEIAQELGLSRQVAQRLMYKSPTLLLNAYGWPMRYSKNTISPIVMWCLQGNLIPMLRWI